MADAWDDLTAAFLQGDEAGPAALSEFERDLYWIMFFVIDYEMGGWEYNWTGEWERFQTVIAAMRRRDLTELARIVSEVEKILHRADTIGPSTGGERTWYEVLDLIDPNGDLGRLHEQIGNLNDYGIPNSWDSIGSPPSP